MSATENKTWRSTGNAKAAEETLAAGFETTTMRNLVNFVRATIAVLGFQAFIRALVLMHQLTY